MPELERESKKSDQAKQKLSKIQRELEKVAAQLSSAQALIELHYVKRAIADIKRAARLN